MYHKNNISALHHSHVNEQERGVASLKAFPGLPGISLSHLYDSCYKHSTDQNPCTFQFLPMRTENTFYLFEFWCISL